MSPSDSRRLIAHGAFLAMGMQWASAGHFGVLKGHRAVRDGSPIIHSVAACRNSHAAIRVARSRPVSASCATCRSQKQILFILCEVTFADGCAPVHTWRGTSKSKSPLQCSERSPEAHIWKKPAKPDGHVFVRIAQGNCQLLGRVPLHDAVLTAAAHVQRQPPVHRHVRRCGRAMPRCAVAEGQAPAPSTSVLC